jgi:hypothetical protein
MTSIAARRPRRRIRPLVATGLVLATSAVAVAPAQARTHGVRLGAGRAAIQQFANKVGNLTGASSNSVSHCGRHGSDVTCHVQWTYALGLACGVKADAYVSGSAVKVRRASGINCTSNFT